jgi:hypothetical protein
LFGETESEQATMAAAVIAAEPAVMVKTRGKFMKSS